MTNSDIIAIVALIVSFVSAGISYWNNRANIKAKRQEIAFEKRLDAFREITEAISKSNRNIDAFYVVCQNFGDVIWNENFKEYEEEKEELLRVKNNFLFNSYRFLDVYDKNMSLFPPHINRKIKEYYDRILADREGVIKDAEDYFSRINPEKDKYLGDIVSDMQKFVGYK